MKHILVLLSCLFFVINSQAGDNAAAFLKIPVDAEVTALGDASTAIDSRVSALFYNPAAMATLEKDFNLFASSRFGLLESTYNVLAFAYHSKIATFAFGWINLGIDKIPHRDSQNNYIGDMSSSQNAYFLSVAKTLLGSYSVGVSLKYVQIGFDLMDEQPVGSGLGLDLGLIYRFSNNLRFGLYLQDNFEIKWSSEVSDKSPLTLKLGAVYKPSFLNKNFGFHADIVQRQSFPLTTNIGMHYTFDFGQVVQNITLRAGVANVYFESRDLSPTASELIGNNISYSAGLGMTFLVADLNVGFNYAFKSHSYLDNAHFTSLVIEY